MHLRPFVGTGVFRFSTRPPIIVAFDPHVAGIVHGGWSWFIPPHLAVALAVEGN